MAVDVVGVEGDVGHHRDLDPGIADRLGRPVRQVVGVPGPGAILGLHRLLDIGKQADRRDAEAAASFAAFTTRSTVSRWTPGIEGTS
jgi:hypothetical protein